MHYHETVRLVHVSDNSQLNCPGALVDSATVPDGPDPAYDKGSKKHLEAANQEGADVDAVGRAVSLEHGSEAGNENVEN